MKNEMSKLQLFWSNNGSVIVDVPNDKVEEFKSFWNDKRIETPITDKEGGFEKHLNQVDGEWLDFNHTWDGYVTDVD